VATPRPASLRAVAAPMPHTSSTAKARSTAERTAGWVRSHTPPKVGFLLATALASLASVLVGPRPTQVGMPVQRRTVARMSWAWSQRSLCPKPERSRNVSSME
jgi:hypothetical protein